MSNMNLETALNDLYALFEAEKNLLMAGKAVQAGSLLAPKKEAMENFEQAFQSAVQEKTAAPYRARIEKVIAMAGENSNLLSATRNGVQNVISRLRGINTGAYVGSYDMKGTSVPFSNATGGYATKV